MMASHSKKPELSIPPIDLPEGLSWHVDQLIGLWPHLAPMRELAGEVAPRVNPKGFAGLAKVVCGQQVSVQSAAAIWRRFSELPGALEPQGYLVLSEAEIRGAGFSASKYRTMQGVAEAVVRGDIDLAQVETLPAEQAIAELVKLKGIGPWTAEVYLLFCAGHPDIFPAGDLALLKAAHAGLGLDARPTIKEMIEIAKDWSPYRSAAALLFWRYFAAMKNREGSLL